MYKEKIEKLDRNSIILEKIQRNIADNKLFGEHNFLFYSFQRKFKEKFREKIIIREK